MRCLRRCYRQLKKKTLNLKFLILLTTVVLQFTLISSLLSNTYEDEGDVYGNYLLDIIYNNNILRERLQQIVDNEEKVDDVYSKFILSDLRNIMAHMHQFETHYTLRAMKHLLTKPIVNDHNFSYIHNPLRTCTRTNAKIIIAVPSAVSNFEKRRKVRNGVRGDYVRNSSNKAEMLFFLARTFNKSIQERVDAEVKEFGDIVQEDFEDIYRNNRLKSVSMLRWISTYCSNANYVVRSDDDIKVNVSDLMPVIERTAEKLNNFILGLRKMGDIPARDVASKYYMSKHEYPLENLPPYLLGALLALPVATAKLLYEAALRIKPIWLEDVYITGICTAVLHIPILTAAEFQFEHIEM